MSRNRYFDQSKGSIEPVDVKDIYGYLILIEKEDGSESYVEPYQLLDPIKAPDCRDDDFNCPWSKHHY